VNPKGLIVKQTRTLAIFAMAALACAAAFATGVMDPWLQLLGMHPDVGASLFLLANGLAAVPGKKTVGEQIVAFEAKRQVAKDGAEAIVAKSVEEGRTLDEHEAEQHATFVAEVGAIDKHIALLRGHEALMLSKAAPITQANTQATAGAGGAQITAAGVISVKSNLPPGIRFTRFACAMAQAKGNVMLAHQIAISRFKDTPEVGNALEVAVKMGGTRDLNQKAAVAAGTTTDSSWAGPLVQYNDMEREFVELLRPKMIMGRMTQLNRVPFMMRAARQLTGVSGGFVGEGAPTPLGKQTYDNVTLSFAKVAVIVVLTDEAVRFSSPNAEIKARDDMIKGVSTYIDKRFMDPSYSGVANVSPASITNGCTRVQSSGKTLAAIDVDVRAAMAPFANSDVDPSTAVWVMPATVALRLSMKRTSQDEKAFPELTMLGGTWYGIPVIVSNAMVTAGSPSELQIALVTQEEVFVADDGGVSIDMSQEASVQMSDSPSAGAQSLVSLWQNNLVGIRAEQYINWAPRRTSNLGITLIENVDY